MITSLLLTLALLAQATGGGGNPRPGGVAPVRIPPDWRARPSAFDIVRVVNRHGPNGFSGVITLRARCLITVAGVATRCEVVQQSYPNYDFRPMIDALAVGLPFQPATENGVPVEEWITIPLRFNMTFSFSRNERRRVRSSD